MIKITQGICFLIFIHFSVFNAQDVLSQLGPADAVSSPAYRELKELKATGKLSAAQADIFMVLRPNEELFDYSKDPCSY